MAATYVFGKTTRRQPKENNPFIVGSLAAILKIKKTRNRLVYCLHFLFVIQYSPYI